ncbi:MAG: FAD-binding oxidoreductase [Planctomycetes bacterium]|nr:FAD-binding oxidoreductase [Planctomycetota bacterium]
MADSLSQAGLNVVLLDRRHLGRGSTAASTALLQYDIDTPLHQLRETFGKAKADRAYQLGIEAIEAIEQISRGTSNGFHRRPSLYVARDEAAAVSLKEEFDARRDAGLAVEWLAAEAVREEYGFDVCAAIRSAVAGEVDPFRLTQTLLSRSMERGVQIFDRTEVAEIDESDGVVTVRCESGHFVRARWIVHATGYEAVETLPRRIVSLHSTFAMISEPIRSSVLTWWDQALVWEYADPYHYARWVDDRIVYGGGDVSFRNAAARDRLIEKKTAELQAAFGIISVPKVHF